MSSPAEVEPELALWGAALALLLQDAFDYLKKGNDSDGYRGRAYAEVTHGGPALRRLCGFACVDPELAREVWLRRLGEDRRAA